jgi:hypothetical protein
MLISPAYAQAGGAPAGFDLISLMPLVLIFVVFYFLLIRPQQRKMKLHREMIGAVKRGDKVLTAGGRDRQGHQGQGRPQHHLRGLEQAAGGQGWGRGQARGRRRRAQDRPDGAAVR